MTTVEVLVDEAGRTRLVGQAHFTRTRGQVSTTFLYDLGYLSGDGMAIDPALPLVSGSQHQTGLVRAFADSAPWGAATQWENRAAAIIAFAREVNPSLPHVPLPKPSHERHLRPVQ